MRRGEVRLADLGPAVGSEARGRRPVVLVSNDAANAFAARTGSGVVTVVPLTSNVTKVYAFQVLLTAEGTGLRVASKAQAEQVRAIAATRLGPALGALPPADLRALDKALRVHLQL